MIRHWFTLPIITPFPPGMTAAGSANFSLEALMSNANAYAEQNVTVATASTDTTLTTAQLLAKNIVLTVGASGAFTITLPATARILDALGPTIPRDGSFYFPLYISNRDTTFTGTLTAGDASTTLAGPATLDNNANGKWIIQVNAATTATAAPTLTFTRISTCDAGGGGGGGVGTVTSVAQTVPVEFIVTGSPITGSGTLAITKATELANTVWAGPTTGAAAQPTFRALVSADIPVNNFGTVAVSGQSNVVADTPSDTLTLVGGTNITITTNAGSDSVTIAAASGTVTNSFETIAVSGQSDVVADSPTDTLTLVAGSNMTITTNAGSDTVTFTAAGAGATTDSFSTIAVAGQSDVVADSPTDTLTLVGSGVAITTNAGTDTITLTVPSNTGISTGDSWLWGSGRDGVVHFDGINTFSFATISTGSGPAIYILLRAVHATDCIIDAGVIVAPMDWTLSNIGGGNQIYCTGTLTVNGHLNNDGKLNDINRNIGGIGGSAVAGLAPYYGTGTNAGAGSTSTGANGNSAINSFGGIGGNGGDGGTGNLAGQAGSWSAPSISESGGINMLWTLPCANQGVVRQGTGNFAKFTGGTGGGGGGGVPGNLGGGGGGGGGCFGIWAREMAGSGIISCDGANGNDGFASGAGGGGGGGGGVLMIWTTTSPLTMTTSAAAGAGGAGIGAGLNGSAGTVGNVAILTVLTLA